MSPPLCSPLTVRPSLSPKMRTVIEVSVYWVSIMIALSVLLRKTRFGVVQLIVASIPSG